MVNELKELLRDNVASPPPDHLDLAGVVDAGRRRTRARRTTIAGVGAGALALTVVAALLGGGRLGADRSDPATDGPPRPDAPVVRLSDAAPAVEGRDYDELTSYTNQDLDADNGQYLDGVTDDGLVLFRDGPRADQLYPRFALLDPRTGTKDWLPRLAIGQEQTWPIELGAKRLVLVGTDGEPGTSLTTYVLDRGASAWRTMTWHGLPASDFPRAQLGPEDRLYVSIPATQGRVPEGGWPTQEGGDAEDAGAEGDTYHLWSVSLDDASDVRDEGLTLGSLAFTDSSMVWTDSTNGAGGRIHVRDLATGVEHSFDPHSGERCNLLGFGATDDRVVLSQYCGTYGKVRDDRVQILTLDGQQVATIQDSGIEGGLAGTGGTDDVVAVTQRGRDDASGTYTYDLADNRLLRLSDATSHFALGGLAPAGLIMWDTPVNQGHGATQHIGRLH